MDLARIKFVVEQDGTSLDLYAQVDGQQVGKALCTIIGATLTIHDLEVKDSYRAPAHSLFQWLGFRRRPVSLRRHGIGTALIHHLFEISRQLGVHEMRGSVVRNDIDRFPGLLAWYKRFGFLVTEPDEACMQGAVYKISFAAALPPHAATRASHADVRT